MDLKFTFGGASPDHHDHGDAPSGIPLPFSTVPSGSSSSVLEARVRLVPGALVAEAVTGDGVVYASGEAPLAGSAPGPLSATPAATQPVVGSGLGRAVRSALSRAVAGLEGPLAESVSAIVLDLGGAEVTALQELGVDVDLSGDPVASVDETLQRRIGVSAGTPVRFGA
ncbi:MAG: hypothetical protein WDA07_03170 [Leucobacter sp.]